MVIFRTHIIVRLGSAEAAPGIRILKEEQAQMLRNLKGIALLLIANFLIMIRKLAISSNAIPFKFLNI